MHILLVNNTRIPAFLYGGTERVIWSLGKALVEFGHRVTYLVAEGSECPFAEVIAINPAKSWAEQIPAGIDIAHFQFDLSAEEKIPVPFVVTIHGNPPQNQPLHRNAIFVSKNHASRYGSEVFVHNGLDWSAYSKPDFTIKRKYFHFLGKAAWRVKNVQGAIDIIHKNPHEKLRVLGGVRFNFNMGIRLTFSPRVRFYGMIGGEKKEKLLNASKGLIFPVRWHEPFGLAIIESLYYGAPVFGTPYGSLPELVGPDQGFLSNDSSQIAAAMMQNTYDAQVCHQYAKDHFNQHRMAERYLVLYQQVLAHHTLNQTQPLAQGPALPKFLPWT